MLLLLALFYCTENSISNKQDYEFRRSMPMQIHNYLESNFLYCSSTAVTVRYYTNNAKCLQIFIYLRLIAPNAKGNMGNYAIFCFYLNNLLIFITFKRYLFFIFFYYYNLFTICLQFVW